MSNRFLKWRRVRRNALFAFFSYTALGISFVLVGILWVWIVGVVREFGPVVIPLHRTVYYGIDYLGKPSVLFFLPAFGTLICALHTGLGIFLFRKDRFFAYCLWSSVLFLELFLALGALSIIRNL
ncbi:MAG TPA: hypothetical protein VJB93_04375 [Patescibacteria group bacterium]|nr:hypothetical protein [Patescibacteria group bacterium]